MNLLSNEVVLAAGNYDALWYLVVAAFFGIGKLIEFINAKKMQAENKSGRQAGKKSTSQTHFDEFQNESAEDFFARIEGKKKKKPKVSLDLRAEEPKGEEMFERKQVVMPSQRPQNLDLADSLPPAKSPKKRRSSKMKVSNIIDRQDLKSIRKAIIIKEVLGEPQAFKY